MDPDTNAIRNDEIQYALDEREPAPDPAHAGHVHARGNGKLTQFKTRLMNRAQRRREGHSIHAGPTIMGRAGTPAHVIRWRTLSDRDLVLYAIRLGVLVTGRGRQPWGPGGQFKTRKALYVAVARAERAGVQPTQETNQTAEAVADRWAEQDRAGE